MDAVSAADKSKRFRQTVWERIDRPGWKKFAIAMIALGLAFVLAVYSSVFALRGNVLVTGLFASAALLLSGWVAITVVPYLARRTGLGWLRAGMDYRLTKEGSLFIGLILVLAIAGLNTGNNLLYLMLSSMLAAILMSGILSLAVLTGVELDVLLPDHVFARRLVPARIHLQNDKRRIPSFSVTVSSAGKGAERIGPKRKRWRSKAATVAREAPPDRRILRRPLYFPFLPGGKAVVRTVDLEFPQRGLYREDGFFLSTRFPFGFLEKTLRLPVSRDLWVYPAVEPTGEFYEILPMLSGELEAFQKGRGHDLYSIRDMLPTDSARHVDWKASARTQAPKVREFAREDERRLQLILDPRIGPPNARMLALFEAAVEFSACLAWHFYEVDAQMEFRCGEFSASAAPAGEVIYDILRHLAAVQPSAELPEAPPEGSQGDVFRIVCTALPRGSVPTMLWSRSYFVFFDTLKRPETITRQTREKNLAME
jgi:uncharacterized protein (DUF58 family)